MMRNLSILILIVFSCSCNEAKKAEIPLFNEVNFKLNDGEALIGINVEAKNSYELFFNSNQFQIPLLKYIKHDNYEIFIGLPFRTTIDKMVQYQVEKLDSIAILSLDSNGYHKYFQINNHHITEYATLIDNQSLLYIATLCYSKEISDSLFNQISISNRIVKSVQ